MNNKAKNSPATDKALPKAGQSAVNYALTLSAGMLISVMVFFNGRLNDRVGFQTAGVIVHTVGLVVISLVLLLRGEKPRVKGVPPVFFTAGLIGVGVILSNNLSFGHISVSAMMALGLLGESVTSLTVDHFGLFGLPRRPFRWGKLGGLVLSLCGIAFMLTDFKPLPVTLSLLAGVGVVMTRLINGQLAQRTSPQIGTFFNYVVGLSGAILVYFLMGGSPRWPNLQGVPFYAYLGGATGVVIVMTFNYVVKKIPSLYMTMTLFIGQVLAGLMLDMLMAGSFPVRILVGGLFVLCGLTLNLWQDRQEQRNG